MGLYPECSNKSTMKLKLSYPLKDVQITQKFGENATPIYAKLGMRGHNGIDFHAPHGTPVLAMHDGKVTYTGLDGSNGNLLVLLTEEMFDYGDTQAYYKTLYGHLLEFKVKAGEHVKQGQVIALADNTGASTGAHLHIGVKGVRKGEEEWEYFNIDQANGYNGATDPAQFLPLNNEFKVSLKLGDVGDEVAKLQAFLLRNGYMKPVNTLGFYGEITAKAILDFQIKNVNLSYYERYVLRGRKVGPKTLTALNKY